MDSITFRCTACDKVLKVSAEKAGRKVKCSKCGTAITIPATANGAPAGQEEAVAPKPAAAPPPPPPPAPPKVDDDDEGGTYGLSEAFDPPPSAEAEKKKKKDDEEDEDELEDQLDEDGELIQKVGTVTVGEGPGRRAAAKVRTLLEPEKWLRTVTGIKVVAIGIWIWLGEFALRQVPLIIGIFNPSEYALLATRYFDPQTAGQILRIPEDEARLGKAEFLAGLATGADSLEAGLWLARGAQLLALIASLTLLTGYVFCLAVPERFGTRGLVKALLGVGAVNLIFGIVFRLLAYFGAIDYVIVPVAAPEVTMASANIDRVLPISLLLSSIPFLDYFLTFVILLTYFAEPVLFCIFLRAVARSMKDEVLDVQAQGLVRLGLGTAFMYLFFLMTSMAGTSQVLLMALLAIYTLAACFYIGQLAYYAVVFLQVPPKIMKQIDLDEIGKSKPGEEEEEDEDEDEEDEDKPRGKKRARDEDEDEDD